MKKTVFLTCGLLALNCCDNKKAGGENGSTSPAPTGAKAGETSWRDMIDQAWNKTDWKTRGQEMGNKISGQAKEALSKIDLQAFKNQMDTLGLKQGAELSDKMAAEAKAALVKIDLQALQTQLDDLGKALSAGDFQKAGVSAETLDSLLQSKSISQSIRFLEIQSKEGAVAAQKAISEYVEDTRLSVQEQEFYKFLQKEVTHLTPERTAEIVTFVVAVAIWVNMPGSGHESDILGMVVASAVAPLVHNTVRIAFGLEPLELGPMYSRMLDSKSEEAK